MAPLFVAVALRASAPLYTRWAAFRLGLLTGILYFAGTLYWTVDVMAQYGGIATPVAVGCAALLVLYLSLYIGAVAVLLGDAVRRLGVRGVWLAPVFWVALEWTRGWIGGGFPWVPLGSSQATVLPIAQLAAVTGVYGLSFLVALVSAAAAVLALTRQRTQLFAVAGVAGLVLAVAAAGAVRLMDNRLNTQGRVVRVGLVQGNVPQDMKWDPKNREMILQRYLQLSRQTIQAGAELVIWPESSTPFFLERDSALAAPIHALAAQTKATFVVGTDEFDGEKIYNTASVIGADGRTRGVYRKMHLVPFGEYVPLKKLLFFVGPLVEAVSDFSPGTDAAVLDLDHGMQGSVAICYESTYPSLAREFVARGASVLMVITNDAWFGLSSAAFQHFEMGALRAIENGRYLARAGNTGVTAIVDPYGRVTARLDLFEAGALSWDLRLLDGRTIYTRIGDLIAWLSAALTLACMAAFARRA